MTKNEQRTFVRELMTAIHETVQEAIENGKVPEAWNGIELRQLLADKFAASVMPLSKAQRKAYDQSILERNL